MSDGSNIWAGIAIGAVVTFFIMYSSSQNDLQGVKDTYQEIHQNDQSCISGYKEMVSRDAESVSSSLSSISSDLSFAEGEDYGTISDAISEAKDAISSMSSDYDYISKEPKECFN